MLSLKVWDPSVGAEGEIKQGKLLVDAAKATGVKHFVWSTLDSTPYKASHWESKDVVDKYLRASGVPRTSYVMLGISMALLWFLSLPLPGSTPRVTSRTILV